jgi:hypothetical protein
VQIGRDVRMAVLEAFRVEALVEEGIDDFGHEWQAFRYRVLFDVENAAAREASTLLRKEQRLLQEVIAAEFGDGPEPTVEVRVCSSGVPAEGLICGREDEPPPKRHIDVTDVPTEKPDSNVPLIQKDGYWLTPIELPFYDALRRPRQSSRSSRGFRG